MITVNKLIGKAAEIHDIHKMPFKNKVKIGKIFRIRRNMSSKRIFRDN